MAGRTTHPARAAARRLAAGRGAPDALSRLGRRAVALGDSLTADPRSYAEILRLALDLAGRGELLNLGVPGDTTVHLVSRFADVCALDPDLLIVLAGTNDARRHGHAGRRMLVPDAETRANLEVLLALAREQTRARVVFVTPPPVIEDRIARAPLLVREPVSWRAADVERKAAIVGALRAEVIDSRRAIAAPLAPLLLEDGLHLSLRGQERLARWVLRCLSRS